MELVEGHTLKGPLPLDTALDYARQIADALDAAHEKGIVHRDLKPGNIMVTSSGVIKVLDFRLAKVAEEMAGDFTQTMSRGGAIMGTPRYMAPEQAQGKVVDKRADVWAFGCVLYEMLTGTPAFSGETTTEILAAVVGKEPDLEAAPLKARRLLRRCLEKNPKSRLRHVGDASELLESEAPKTARGLAPSRLLYGAIAALACIGLAVAAGVLLRRPNASPRWSGALLGGPEMAENPRLSPDGHLLAFAAMIDGLSQVAVMKPESGNWVVLTHRRDRGVAADISWSPDGALIYYGRGNTVPKGVYSVPVLGGDEHLVLDDAWKPEALPDGSMLLSRLNPQQQERAFRFWPETGRLKDLPLELDPARGDDSVFRAAPGAKQAVVLAWPIGTRQQGVGLFGIDLASNGIRRLAPTVQQAATLRGWGVAREGTAILASMPAGAMRQIVAIPVSGQPDLRPLFTVTSGGVWSMDSGTDGSVYLCLVDQLGELVRLSAGGESRERIASFRTRSGGGTPQVLLLPDGRAALGTTSSGKYRLVAVEPGKDAAPLVNTTEETSDPMTLAGQREIAFVIGPEPHEVVALAEIASGRILRRIKPGKGPVKSLTSSPDGTVLYLGVAGTIWAIPSAGGTARMVCAGDTAVMEPSGDSLLVTRVENSRPAMYHVPLDGSSERRISLDDSISLDANHIRSLSSGSIDARGRLLVPLDLPDSWFNPMGILDTATGRVTRATADNSADYHSAVWMPDSRILSNRSAPRSPIWKFQPEGR